MPEPVELRGLVVDDNAEAATSLSYLLQHLGWRVAVAFGGGTAVAVGKVFMPHLVILDLNLAGMSGCDVLREMKSCGEPLSGAVYVCLTGSNDPADEATCRAAGFDHFLRKPMQSRSLGDALEQARSRALQSASGSV